MGILDVILGVGESRPDDICGGAIIRVMMNVLGQLRLFGCLTI